MPSPRDYVFNTAPTARDVPSVDFSWLSNLPNDYWQGQQYARERALQTMFQGPEGAELLRQNRIDPSSLFGALAQRGGAQAVQGFVPAMLGAQTSQELLQGEGQGVGPVSQAQPTSGGPSIDPRNKIPVIVAAAQKYGVDPQTAICVARSEGLNQFTSGIRGEDSFGAFQLNTQGGLGNDFRRDTGLDPRDPKNEDATIDYALKKAAQVGWEPFHGAKNTGIPRWAGIGRGGTTQVAAAPGVDVTVRPRSDQAAVDRPYSASALAAPPGSSITNAPAPVEQPAGAFGTAPFNPATGPAASSVNSGPANIVGTRAPTRVASLGPAGLQGTAPASAAEVAANVGGGTGAAGGPGPGAPASPNSPAGRDVVAQGPAETAGAQPSTPAGYDQATLTRLRQAQQVQEFKAKAAAANPYAPKGLSERFETSAANLKSRADAVEKFLAERSQTEYGVGIEGRKKALGAVEEARGKRIGEAIEAGGKPARDTLNSLNVIGDALASAGKNISTGPGAEYWLRAKQAYQSLFPDENIRGVPEAEVITKMNARLAAAAAKSMTARPSQLEFRTFVANNPGLMNSIEGTKALINILAQTTQQDIALGRKALSLKNIGDWGDVEDQFYKENRIKSPFTGKPLTGEETTPRGMTAAPGAPAAGKYRWTPEGGLRPY